MQELLRNVTLKPYRKGAGPTFCLKVWDTNKVNAGKSVLAYRLTQSKPRRVLFEGDDFGCSPCVCVDSDEMLVSLLGFLCLRPGDTDAEYFENYTEQQLEFCGHHAESLGFEALCRFEHE